MELALNLGWVLVTVWMVCEWASMAPRTLPDRRSQFVALGVVILILLPAISMTDDLLAARNPAEADCCVRRDQACTNPHSIVPVTAALPLPANPRIELGFLRMSAPSPLSPPHARPSVLGSILNRPPPAV